MQFGRKSKTLEEEVLTFVEENKSTGCIVNVLVGIMPNCAVKLCGAVELLPFEDLPDTYGKSFFKAKVMRIGQSYYEGSAAIQIKHNIEPAIVASDDVYPHEC